ncbi:cell division protein FtsQ/DivIB [Halioxenophilus sp. WMMB6]|uniref:cell division protein FtsQ/DivIB n=1 Tax=Halioxenophilus sp. WMMB6 TaxID=3073815 RepID=UPI00295ECAB3|nr:cell division protein FtsQ/DivIB [Halioxenophilus sp. WMMB6]
MTLKDSFARVVDQPIAAVDIKGNLKHVTEADLRTLLEPVVNRRFLNVDLLTLKERVEADPWIAQATLSRRWPDRLQVSLVEETAIARWGDSSFLNQAGEEKNVGDNSVLQDLPLLRGPEQSQQKVARKYVEIASLLLPLALQVNELTLEDDLSWQLALDNGLVIRLGRDQLLEKIKRFSTVYETVLKPKLADIYSVDLRYHNGLAVEWSPQALSLAN